MARWEILWDKKALIKDLLIFLVVMVACYVTKGAGFAVMFLIAGAALMRKDEERLLMVMMVTVGVLVGNSNIFPKTAVFYMEQRILIVLLAACLMFRPAGMRHSPLLRPFLLLMPYILYMATVPSLDGWSPLVSYLKLFLFITCYFAYFGIANYVIFGERAPVVKVRSVFLSLCCFTLIGSVLVIPFPGISQLSAEAYQEAIANGQQITSLFTGMMYHSQSLGALVAMLFVTLLSDYIFSIRKKDWLYIILLLCAPLLIYKTSSRTSMGAMLAGTMFTLWLFMQSRQAGAVWKARVMSVMSGLLIAGIIVFTMTSSGQQAFAKYVLKWDSGVQNMSQVSMDDIVSTRQGLMDESMRNFRKKPLFGNGFQVSEGMAHVKGGLANVLSAPIEKGVWVTAILEEGGVIGMVLFVSFGLFAIPLWIKRKAYTTAAIIFTIYVVNLGEFNFFSMSGIGGYYWAIAFMGTVLDAQRLRELKIVTWYATEEEIAHDPDLNPYA